MNEFYKQWDAAMADIRKDLQGLKNLLNQNKKDKVPFMSEKVENYIAALCEHSK
jgi:primosomal protein N''